MANSESEMNSEISKSKIICALFVLLFWLPLSVEANGMGGRGFYSDPVGQEEAQSVDPVYVDLDQLSAFVEDAYAGHGQSDFAEQVLLNARIASSVLSVSEHHHRVVDRLLPGFDGYFLAISQPDPRLEYIDAPFFGGDTEYTPDAPLKEMVILEVSGEIGFEPLDYEAFIFRFVSPEGSCRIELSDPVFPGVSSFASDELLAAVFPECEGPQAARERVLLEAVPGLSITGYDESTGMIIAVRGAAALSSSENTPDPQGVPEPTAGPADGCDDYNLKVPYGWDSSMICSDLWFGHGDWVRGGNYWQEVTCIPEGDGCTVQTVNSGDNLHSSIRPDGWGSCQCCNNYGATVTGNTASAHLISQDGLTGGHVAIAKSPKAWRTSTSQSMSALQLEGECAGDLDLPHHGSSANASGAFDYQAKNQVQTNKAQIGGWNAENITSHLCKPNKKEKKPVTVVIQID
ncbi:MAG: hypothetical protein P8Q97_09580 [Myxococcota bacterium]|nr:hypothetical protein [Myxococcota bacterium]